MENTVNPANELKEIPKPSYSEYNILASGIREKRGIKKRFFDAQRQQADILIYLYNHPSLSAKNLRSLFKLNKITGYRQAGALRKAGFIRWKGSHVRGGYVITEEGKKFLEEKLLNKAPAATP